MDQLKINSALPASPREFGFWIDGAYHGGREMFERASPGHGVPVTRIPKCSVDDLNAAVAAARRAFEDRSWA
ncbi:MAG: sorbosone dehydrogenase, partial [Gemmobacter sp.]